MAKPVDCWAKLDRWLQRQDARLAKLLNEPVLGRADRLSIFTARRAYRETRYKIQKLRSANG